VLNFVLSYFQVIQHFPGWYNHLFNCGLLLFALLQRTKIKPYQVPRSLLLIGNSSFSLYLVHPLLLTYLPKALRQLGITRSLEGGWYFMGMFLLIVVCAYASYQLIEQRLSRKILSWFMPHSK
jgi:peptidoglycan/LPS O-acetylase OafA/YrhL